MYSAAPKITLKGGDHVRHFQGVPYVDTGVKASVTLEDGASKTVPFKTLSNTVPPGCETLAQYEIVYEAIGPGCNCCGCQTKASLPDGARATAKRIVEIGQFMLCKLTTTIIF